jgi:hypothetical protein
MLGKQTQQLEVVNYLKRKICNAGKILHQLITPQILYHYGKSATTQKEPKSYHLMPPGKDATINSVLCPKLNDTNQQQRNP